MAKKYDGVLPLSTEVEVIKTDENGKHTKKVMTYETALRVVKQKNQNSYKIFQLGFSQFKIENDERNTE